MKTFSDLQFKPHTIGNGIMARLFFENGYGISVVQFDGSYTSGPNEYEVAVLQGDEKKFGLTYSTTVTDDVIGHLEKDGVTAVMAKIQALKKGEENGTKSN